MRGTPSKQTSIGGVVDNPKTPGTAQPTIKTGQFGLRKMPSHSALPTPGQSRISAPSPSGDPTASKYGSKTVSSRPLQKRASAIGLFKKPALPSSTATANSARDPEPNTRGFSAASSFASADDRNLSSVSPASTTLTVESIDDGALQNSKKSSSALRDQIAKAKAARRAASSQLPSASQAPLKSPLVPTDTSFDFGLHEDPFGLNQLEDAGRKVMQSRISTARTTGRLNIAAMGFKQIPDEVIKMYDTDGANGTSGSWAECVDLTRFVAANNELETLEEALFPDADPSDFVDDDDYQGHQFGGLEALDLHGNMLIGIPMGLRRLQVLTTLNLSQNKLTNSCLEVISQVLSLRDLKLGNNLLYGQLEDTLTNLENLESLDLQGNNISALPKTMDRLRRLRLLNVNENDLVRLPFDALSVLPLSELTARRNKLSGTLIDPEVETLRHLQILDVSVNQLTALTVSQIELPALHQLTVSMNRIQSLPHLASWKSLLTIHADENSIKEFPEGFLSLDKLRQVDFTSNDIKVIPAEISRMGKLDMLRIAGNPLRDKKFTSLSTEELKNALAARLAPPEEEQFTVDDGPGSYFDSTNPSARSVGPREPQLFDKAPERAESDSEDFATPPTSAHNSPLRHRSNTASTALWPVKQGGILDRSATQSSSLHPVVCSKLAAQESVREIRLHNNTFTSFPTSLSFFADTLTSLSISNNELVGESYFGADVLDLTALTELNISSNRITSVIPLTTQLRAPNLAKLDLSRNRITTLPAMRDFFPSLTVLLINDNHIEELSDVSIAGLKIVDARNNDIAHLNPRIGLLGGAGGLERLEVTGNRFRVPRWNILDLGTEATLRWLRGRMPVAEIAEWKIKAGEASDDFEV